MKPKFDIGDKLIYVCRDDYSYGFSPVNLLVVSKIIIEKDSVYYKDEERENSAFEEEVALLSEESIEDVIKIMADNVRKLADERINELPERVRSLLND